jgi:hypothetical protein
MKIKLWQHKPQGEDWKTEKAKSRAEFYVKEAMSFGMSEVDAQCMINDLYWDCYSELKQSGAIKEGWKND